MSTGYKNESNRCKKQAGPGSGWFSLGYRTTERSGLLCLEDPSAMVAGH